MTYQRNAAREPAAGDFDTSEDARLAALDSYDILDTPSEEAFDRITRLARKIFGVSMATVTLLDGHRQWFKSRQGVSDCETERGPALCNVAMKLERPLVVPDTHVDARFENNPLVIGSPFVRFYAGAQLRTPNGFVIGTLCAMDSRPRPFDDGDVAILRDLAQLVLSELELRKIAMHDALTGAISRRGLREELKRSIALAVRHKHELSCVMFDLDHFKAINERHGHGVGDLALKAAVEACRTELRATDTVGRFGGEEFAVILPHTSRKAALEVAEKIRASLARVYVQADTGPVRMTASFGVASLDAGACDVDQIIKRAEVALCEAKATGRNNCKLWTASEPGETIESNALRRVLKAGLITFNAGSSTIDCTVRGLSKSGALLNVISTADIPLRFKLGIAADEMHRLCSVVAKRDKQIEVAFE
jgi:diguanylate cyclase (GGDEF)-like protein